ncbi:hypothetical protein N800_01405 [Lysobacter daejeonensis GH1-9]|uniref:Uncharacterized protein n=1 Tax=Lysobacter daejeonensis GH1-9 TaxID=1385517 RepID=A0A0A0EY04_9GAMM|nr:hypothetical protein [Lysobacter daejeonensis]KGM54963.1 hypothetical protein N800_01405 [Lysobacter daejeonensis GH1-9]
MNNALRHTALTLAAASALLVLVALPSDPSPAQPASGLPNPLATVPGAIPSTAALGLSSTDGVAEAPKRVIRKSARHRRQTLVMPFFSFAQRG